MKALITDIKRFAVHDGHGIRTTVFFKGCPLHCLWCHNPESIDSKPQLGLFAHKCVGCGECVRVCPQGVHKIENGKHLFDRSHCTLCGKCADACVADALKLYGTEMTVEELLPLLLADREFYGASDGGVTLSGGECLQQADFCAALLRALKSEGIHTAVDTCGFVSRETLDKVIPFTDIFLYDIKAMDGEIHKICTGQDNRVILENLKYLDNRGCRVEIRYPFVPHYNDGEMEKMGAFLQGLSCVCGIRVLPYHNFAGSKYASLGLENTMPDIPLPSSEALGDAKRLLRETFCLRMID